MRAFALVVAGLLASTPRIGAAEPYVTASLGYADVEWSHGAPLNGAIDDRAVGYGVDLGFDVGKRWGVELGTYGYGSFDARGTPCAAGSSCPAVVTEFGGTDIRMLKLALVPRFVIGNTRLFATLGYFRATIDTDLPLPDAKWRDRGAVVGLGTRWYFRDPWSISVQATRFDDNLRQLMVGVGWGLRRDRDRDDNE